jgi:superfamily I DNA/RNA helicase
MKRAKVKLLAPLLATGLFAAGAWAGVVAGPEPGEPTLSVPVLDITGKYAGKRICYVCEFQDDPNVVAFFRDADEETAELIVQLDELYRQEKDRNFSAVAIIVAGPDAKPWLEELERTRNIEIPLTVLYRGPKDVGVRLYELNPEVRNTFLVTVNRLVDTNISDIGPGEFDEIRQATLAMLAEHEF